MHTTKNTPRRICLIGARGIGKTSLIRAALPFLDNWVHVIGSEVLQSLLPKGQSMDNLSPEICNAYRHQAASQMLVIKLEGKVGLLCEGHCALYSQKTGKFFEVFTPTDEALFTEIIELRLSASEILGRRQRDKTKTRSLSLGAIEMEIAAEHHTALSLCVKNQWKLTTIGADDLRGILSILKS